MTLLLYQRMIIVNQFHIFMNLEIRTHEISNKVKFAKISSPACRLSGLEVSRSPRYEGCAIATDLGGHFWGCECVHMQVQEKIRLTSCIVQQKSYLVGQGNISKPAQNTKGLIWQTNQSNSNE